MLTVCVVSSTVRSYIELGIFTHMSVELPLLGGGCCIENVVYFVVTIAYLYEFAVSRGINIRYLTSILVPCWLKGFPTMNTVTLSISHICILLTVCS